MKVLMVNKFLYPRGGAETYMLKLGENLTKQGCTVEYFGMYDEKNTVGNQDGLYTYHMDFHANGIKRFLYPFKILYSMEAKKKITHLINRFQPDVIHFNNINFQLTPSVIDAAKKQHVPVVWTMHDYQTVCPNHLLYRPQDGAICEHCITHSRMGCVAHKCIHGSCIKSMIGAAEGFLYSKKKTYKTVARFICPSRFMESILLKRNNVFAGKTTVVHNFIEMQSLPQVSAKKKKYVLFAGRLSPEKGIRLLAETAKLLPDIPFVVAGDGAEKYVFDNIPNVQRVGFLKGEALNRVISEATFMVVPSVWYENCPLSILEAQSFGTPVITANRGGMAELVEHGKDGILVNVLTAENLAGVIREVFFQDNLIREMSNACIKKRSCMLTLEDYTKQILCIYQQVIKEKK